MKMLLGAFALSSLLAAPVLAGEQTVRISVGGLTCPSCSFIVASALKEVPSVVIDDFSEGPEATQGIYVVTFDDAKTTPEDLVDAVEVNGYPADLLTEDATGDAS